MLRDPPSSDRVQTAIQMLKFGITAVSGVAVNLLAMTSLITLIGMNEIEAAVLSTILVLFLGYIVVETWIFSNGNSKQVIGYTKRGGQYYTIMIGGKGVNILVYSVLLSHGFWYPTAWVIGGAISFVFTFSLNKHFLD